MAVKPLRVLQVGCGGMAQRWAQLAVQLPAYELVGLVDLRREAAEATADKHGLPRSVVFDSLKAALKKAKPDVVFDVTVPAAHHKVVIEALRAGCHVLGEKPMSDSLTHARRMVAEAKKADRLYAITQTQRNVKSIMAVSKFCQGGKLGPIEEAHADFFIGAHFGGFRDVMEDVLIADMAIHHFDAARKITGADPVSVYCHSFNPGRSWYKGHASAVAVFEMTGGIVFSYRGSWCAEGANTGWGCDWRILCGRGAVRWNGGDVMQAQRVKDLKQKQFIRDVVDVPIAVKDTGPGAQHGYMLEFARCIRQGKRPETDCEDNIKSLAMVVAAIKSSRTGRKVKVTW